MKRILLFASIAIMAFVKQGKAETTDLTIISSYYGVKDALIKGDLTLAASKVKEFIAVAKSDRSIEQNKLTDVLAVAEKISAAKTIKEQRDSFSVFSNAMIALAKSNKLSSEPIFAQYCPMKKSYWLSNEKTIKNPYYGSAMLTCGTVVETL